MIPTPIPRRLFRHLSLAYFSIYPSKRIDDPLARPGRFLFHPVLQDHRRAGLAERFPALFVSRFFFLAGLIAFFTGLILDLNVYHERKAFEFRLQIVSEMMGRKTMKKIVGMFTVVVCSALAGLLCLWAVHLIPSDLLTEHLAASEALLKEEGPSAFAVKWGYSQLDNFTDNWMIHIAAYDGGQSALERSLMNYYHSWPDKEQVFDELMVQADNPEYTDLSYERYWHGYEVWLRPLLVFTDYRHIRYINLALQLLLTAMILFTMYRRGLKQLILPYILMLGTMLPPTLWRCMQYSSIFSIMSLGGLAMILKYRSWSESGRLWLTRRR